MMIVEVPPVGYSAMPVVVSLSTNLPDFIDTGPPGRTVHVAAARTGVTPQTAARTAAGTAHRPRAYRLRTCCRPPQGGLARGSARVLTRLVPGARIADPADRGTV